MRSWHRVDERHRKKSAITLGQTSKEKREEKTKHQL